MVDIIYTEITEEMDLELWDYYFKSLPLTTQDKVNQYKRWQDKHASLFGRLLIKEGAGKYGYPSDCLGNISFEEHGRPFLDTAIDFNISHSDKYIIGAFSRGERVGVDIEKMSERINLSDFEPFMGHDRIRDTKLSEKPYGIFYEFWTKCESIIKADGRGMSMPLSNVKIKGDSAILDGTTWFLKKIHIDPEFCCHVATNSRHFDFCIRKTDFYRAVTLTAV